jgi:thiamine-monophosphate kinase
LGEFELIDRYFTVRPDAPGARPDVILGVGDDAAVLRLPPDTDLVAAVDTLVAGRHFLVGSAARAIGHRALAVNLSDLAAMGAQPAWATLALTMPAADPVWLAEFSGGLGDLALAHGVRLVGGDTTCGPLTISVQILGWIEPGTALRRGGGQPGDLIAVTGTLGDAGAGLALQAGRLARADAAIAAADVERAAAHLIRRFEYPTPRVEFGRRARGLANAAMDISDGLAGDLPKLAAAAGLAARIDLNRLPISDAMRRFVPAAQAELWALSAGDDYELLTAVPPCNIDALAEVARELDLTLTVIGELQRGSGVAWYRDGALTVVDTQGYDHFL